jgi:hypothetical protein
MKEWWLIPWSVGHECRSVKPEGYSIHVVPYEVYESAARERDAILATLATEKEQHCARIRERDAFSNEIEQLRAALEEIKAEGHSQLCENMKPIRPGYTCTYEIADQALQDEDKI